MKSRRRRVRVQSQASSPVQLLSLSLFIMLLAFFIILNSVSELKGEKAVPVMQSVEDAFATKIILRGRDRPVPPPPEAAPPDERTVPADKFQQILDTFLPDYKVAGRARTGIMRVEIPLETLEAALLQDAAAGRGRTYPGGFARALAVFLEGGRAGIPYRLDIVLQTDGQPGRQQMRRPDNIAALARRAGVLAGRLQDEGVPPTQLGIGLEKGREGRAILIFQSTGAAGEGGYE